MLKFFLIAAALSAVPRATVAQGYDYFVMALTWTPSFCETADPDRNREQCDPSRDLGFVLHGLWPQYEDGWPEYCETSERDPSRSETGAMADIMGSGGLAWYQWKKHGRCSRVSAENYFKASRYAYNSISKPSGLSPEMTTDELERAFIQANDDLNHDSMVVTCRGDLIREVRICLDLKLRPRDCSQDVLRSACSYRGDLELPPIP
ncbi:ribonuclease T2 family protein [Amaricoccus tamworthensis]|uniref:ribonuclease T2 family protein n=1 Tax=Amaricoccus tamworthensis TaxID=57002 RepID=UPI003C7BBC07